MTNMTKRAKVLLTLILIASLVRVLIWFVYEPIVCPDTGSYERLALQIKQLDFSQYRGDRGPIYPLLLLIGGMNHKMIWLIQSALGIAITLMLFRIAFRQTENLFISLLIGLSHAVSLSQICFEATILTETLGTFFLVLTLCLFIEVDRADNRIAYYVYIGIITSLAGLTHPLLLFLIPLYFIFFASRCWFARATMSDVAKRLLAFTIPVVVIVLGWSFFNKITLGYFGPTTMTGYHLSQHSGAFIELATDEYSTIRDVYLKYRQERLREAGTHSGTIWMAWPEISEVTGLTFSEISKKLQKMSVQLFVRHPFLYIKGVSRSWMRFWEKENHWMPQKVKFTIIRMMIDFASWIQGRLLITIDSIFWVLVVWYIYYAIVHRQIDSEFNLLIASTVILGSVIQALAEYGGGGARLAIPFQPLIICIVLLWVWQRLKVLKIQPNMLLGKTKATFVKQSD